MAQGLVDSFLGAFTGLMDMDRQKKRDKEIIAQQAVDNAMRQRELSLRSESEKRQAAHQKTIENHTSIMERLAYDKEDRASQNTDSLISSRKTHLSQSETKIGQAAQRMATDQIKFVEKLRADRKKFYLEQQLSEPDADALAAREAADAAEKFGTVTPVGGQVGASLTSLFPQGERPNVGVLPKQKLNMEKVEADIALKVAQRAVAQENLAEKAAEAGIKLQYEKNRNKLQEQRLALGPVEATAKRLGIEIDKLRVQKMKGEIEFQGIHNSIERLKKEKAEKHPGWTDDAKAMRGWLEKEYSSANTSAKNALTHLSSLKEQQRQSDALIAASKSLKPDEIDAAARAKLAGAIQAKQDRAASVAFYQGEFAKYTAMSDGFKKQVDAMMGLDREPMTPSGTVNRKEVKERSSFPGIKGLGMQGPPRPANVPAGWVHKPNGPKGSGWYKP